MNGISTNIAFEIFDSGGKWDFLFGKTLLKTFKAVHVRRQSLLDKS